MTLWEKEIKTLAKDFRLPKTVIDNLIKQTKFECAKRQIPSFYKGSQDEYLYDNAQRKMMKIIYA